ncbi:uncharacterized protein KY384_005190 [Bacidia gigantensis]|uniref:uncharacterized protein n=1 Tax=Bacidia gigantensis TaxID=2732470 RepID=UPI001D059C01|nr:uncharacterized protein KY384_005190 [Bacidia gigantensis]KAG8529709.1 hypothetical protein KY384_005190 [Bacidia gigantensis]
MLSLLAASLLPLLRAPLSLAQTEQQPIAQTYQCNNGGMPTNDCYLRINRDNPNVASAWGAKLDVNADPSAVLDPSVLPNLPDTCTFPMNQLCAFISKLPESSYNHWIWALSPGPGCLAAMFVPSLNGIRVPTYAECHAYIDIPLREALIIGTGNGQNRVSVNVGGYPDLPTLEQLMPTVYGGAPLQIDVPNQGIGVNGSLSSWFMTSYTYIPIGTLPQQPANSGG